MEHSPRVGSFPERRKAFYREVLDFAGRHPGMKVSLFIPRSDLPVLAGEGCFSLVCELLEFCSSGRFLLRGAMRRAELLEYLQEIRKGGSKPHGAGKEPAGLRRGAACLPS